MKAVLQLMKLKLFGNGTAAALKDNVTISFHAVIIRFSPKCDFTGLTIAAYGMIEQLEPIWQRLPRNVLNIKPG